MTVRILVGDVRERLADLPDNYFHSVITSPPYYNLRDYGTAQWDGGDPACDHIKSFNDAQDIGVHSYRSACGRCGATQIDSQIGLEPTLDEYLDTMVSVFREVRRVLRNDGTLWLNIGDSYASSWPAPNTRRNIIGNPMSGGKRGPHRQSRLSGALKPKDLMMVPARLAIALCDDGWYLRSDIIWAKRAPMPESVTDRPTSAHEHIFLLTKQPKYFYDADAVREEATSPPSAFRNGTKYVDHVADGLSNHADERGRIIRGDIDESSRNQRNVWTLSPESFSQAHFATFPTEIPRRCIKAGTSEKGCCAACGAPWVRVVERAKVESFGGGDLAIGKQREWKRTAHTGPGDNGEWHPPITTGWQPSCACGADVVPCVVLDPFFGAGTTGLVSDELGRDCIGIELNPEYAEMSRQRIYGAAPMFAAVEVA